MEKNGISSSINNDKKVEKEFMNVEGIIVNQKCVENGRKKGKNVENNRI